MQRLKYPLIALYLVLLGLPINIFLRSRWSFLWSLDPKTFAKIIFPVFGLIAFSLVSFQVIIGPNIKILKRIFPKIYTFHRLEGLFALLFAVIHPLIILLVYGVANELWQHQFVAPSLRGYIWFGEAALALMLVTVTTAFGAWKLSKFNISWRWLHYLNYAVFISAWAHSWFIGSDVKTTGLKYIWIFYLAAGVGSLLVRILAPSLVGRARTLQATAPDSTKS